MYGKPDKCIEGISGIRTLLDLDYADDLSILDESVSIMNELLEVLEVEGSRLKIGLKINVKKTKLLRLGISEDENLTFGNGKIDQVSSFTYLVVILVKTVDGVKMLKVE